LSLLWSCQQAIVTDFFVNCSEENEGKWKAILPIPSNQINPSILVDLHVPKKWSCGPHCAGAIEGQWHPRPYLYMSFSGFLQAVSKYRKDSWQKLAKTKWGISWWYKTESYLLFNMKFDEKVSLHCCSHIFFMLTWYDHVFLKVAKTVLANV
jgi:hypothetical protein